MSEPLITLITGGSRSGKSRFALEKMHVYPRKAFLATAVAIDSEMKERIASHRKERGADFLTVEEPIHLAQAIRRTAPQADAILVDCLTFWLNNLFHKWPEGGGVSSKPFDEEIQDFLEVLEGRPTALILVTNEVNMGIVPADPSTRHFVERQGWLNQEVAKRADEVVLMVAGIPQVLKQKEVALR